jgi:hypothetical protein
MVLSTNAPKSNADRLRERLAASAATRAAYEQPLEGIVHYKTLVAKTIEGHNRIKRFWREFVEQHPNAATIASEIVPGSEIPPLGESRTMQGPSYY